MNARVAVVATAIVAVALAFFAFRGFSPRSTVDPVAAAARQAPPPSEEAPRRSPQRRAVSRTVVVDPAPADRVADARAPLRVGDERVVVAPTVETIERALATFDKISLEPETDNEDEYDLEAAVRLRQKVLALRTYVEEVDGALEAGAIDQNEAEARLEVARVRITEVMADAPAPSVLNEEQADAFRVAAADQALRIIDPVDPEEFEEEEEAP